MVEVPGQVFDFTIQNGTLIEMFHKIDSFTDVGQGGILGIGFLLLIGGVLLLMLRSYGNERALPVAALITSIIGMFVHALSFIGDKTLWICIALFIISAIYLFKEQSQYE